MSALEPIEIFALVAGALAIASFFGNIYLYCKVKSLRQKIDSIDRMGKLAKLECPELKAAANSKDEHTQVGVVIDLISSILEATSGSKSPEKRKSSK